MIELNPWFLLTLLGTPEMWLGVAGGVAVAYLSLRKRLGSRRKTARAFSLIFVISLLLTFGLVQLVKDVTMVERPCGEENPYCEESYSFPSGHAASIFLVFTSLLIFLPRKWLPILVLPLLVAYSRITLGVHTWMEVVVGSLIGIVITLLVWRILAWKKKI